MNKKRNKELIKSPYPIIETHCHLDYLKTIQIEDLLLKCLELGIEKLITIGVEEKNQSTVVNIASEYKNVFCSQGIHPHHATEWNPTVKELIKTNCQNNKVVAIGEIGLDYHYNHSPQDIQRKVFEEQLRVAEELELPVIIHTREAEADTESILKNFELSSGAVVHCYSSNMELATFCLNKGLYLGFNGIVTFKSAINVKEVLEITPIDKILLETDAPFLSPVPYRGKENFSFYLPFISREIAAIKKIDESELLKQIYKNTTKLFFS